MRFVLIFAAAFLAPLTTGAETIRNESDAGCLAVDLKTPAGPDDGDRNAILHTACADTYWSVDAGGVAQVTAALELGDMCLSVDFRKSLHGKGRTFNVFAAADCDKSLIWEIRGGFIAAEIAATVYCLEASPAPDGPANAIARIGCSGEDASFWIIE